MVDVISGFKLIPGFSRSAKGALAQKGLTTCGLDQYKPRPSSPKVPVAIISSCSRLPALSDWKPKASSRPSRAPNLYGFGQIIQGRDPQKWLLATNNLFIFFAFLEKKGLKSILKFQQTHLSDKMHFSSGSCFTLLECCMLHEKRDQFLVRNRADEGI